MKQQSQFDLAVCSNEHCHMADFKGKGEGEGEGEGKGKGKGFAGLTGREVGRVQHGTEVHFVPHISSCTGVGVAIHL